MSLLSIGDPVEVRSMRMIDGKAVETWMPATVVRAKPPGISVAYADGRRETLPPGQNRYRPALRMPT